MLLIRAFLLLFLLPLQLAAQSFTIHEVPLPDDPPMSQFYRVKTIKGGWASAGRAIKADKGSFGIVMINRNGHTDRFILKAGIQCRFYCLVPDSDSTIISAGYIRYQEDGPQRALLVRWHIDGRLMDSSSSLLDGKDWMMMNELLRGPDNTYYGIGMVRENEMSSPWLLRFNQQLQLTNQRSLPGTTTSIGLESQLVWGEDQQWLYYYLNQEKTALLGIIDPEGNVLKSLELQVPYGYYRRKEDGSDTSDADVVMDVSLLDMACHRGKIYLSGTTKKNCWVAILDPSLKVNASNPLFGTFDDNGGSLLFTGKGLWVPSLISAGDGRDRLNFIELDDSSLVLKRVVHTYKALTMQFGAVTDDGNIVLAGYITKNDKEKAGWLSFQPAEAEIAKADLPKWTSLEGPPGGDATAFSIDAKGNYWLGTGSSGGIYFSNDKGQSWQPRLDGIGPLHVMDLSWRKDTLFAKISDMRLSENNIVDHRDNETFFFRTNKKRSNWKYFSERARYAEINRYLQEESIRKFNAYNERFPLKKTEWVYSRLMTYYKRWGIDFKNESFDLYTHEVTNRFGGFHPLDSGLMRLNNSFPSDVFENSRNIELDGDRMILLAKSGLYFSDAGKDLYQAPVKGLIATDVRMLREGPQGELIALVGTHQVWKRSGEEWKKIFDANEHNREYGKDTVVTGFDIPVIDITARKELVLSYGGDAWVVDSNGRANLLKPHGPWIRGENGTKVNVNIFGATISSSGKAFYTGTDANGNYFTLYEENGDEFSTLINTHSDIFAFLYTDKTGITWFFGDSIYRFINDRPVAMVPRPNGLRFATQVSSNHLGKLVVSTDKGCLVWDPRENEWNPMNMLPPKLEGTEEDNSFSSVAIDDRDQIYLGTAPWYSISCGFGIYGYPSGVFRFDGYRLTSLKNPINNWILSMECDKKGKVLAGTAGSGVVGSK